MIKQVWEEGGGGGGGGGCADTIIESVFQSYYIFVSVFFNSPMPLWVDFTNICIFFWMYIIDAITTSCTIDP